MRQRLKDLLELAKNDRKTKFILGVLVIAVLFTMFAPDNRHKWKLNQQQQASVESPSMGNNEAYNDIVMRFDSEVKDLKTQMNDTRQALDQQGQAIQNFDARTAAIFTKILERIEDIDANASKNGNSADATELNGSNADLAGQTDEPDQFGFEQQPVTPPAPLSGPSRSAVIGIGDSVRVKLIAGVGAPTDGTPYPVLFQVDGDVVGPDNTRLPIGDARVVAAAQGSLSDSRALFRLTDLSINLPTGERKQFKVDGWVVGEDGVRGMKGLLKDPLGRVLGATAVAGFAQGVGQGMARSQFGIYQNGQGGLSELFNGDVLTLAAGSGVAGAANLYAEAIQDRAKQLVPIVEVLSGREATAVFASSTVVDGLYEALQENQTIAALDQFCEGELMKRLNIIMLITLAALTGCSTLSKNLDPFAEPPAPEALLGERTDKALNGEEQKVDTARSALEAMATYQRASTPQPYNPVMFPTVVRLMWVPDHLNKTGDLVPAHYYYVKVLKERWAVTDSYELEEQLGSKTDSSSVPYVYSSQRQNMRANALNISLCLALVALSACSSEVVTPVNPPKVFLVATRQLPPAPLYNRLRDGLPSEPIPPTPNMDGVPMLSKVYQFEMHDATLQDVAKQLARAIGYSDYCSSAIAKRKVDVMLLGNVDEIAGAIGKKANVTAVIDHENREIRFLAKTVNPKLFEGSGDKVD